MSYALELVGQGVRWGPGYMDCVLCLGLGVESGTPGVGSCQVWVSMLRSCTQTGCWEFDPGILEDRESGVVLVAGPESLAWKGVESGLGVPDTGSQAGF